VLLLGCSTVLADSQVTDESCFPSGWPSERSDLQPDPSLLRGMLDNGLRYVIKKNGEPKNRVAIYLHVPAGSLQEEDDQRGGAHFLEHMLFNGSENFPPGSLVEYFQRIGMDFGGDINAFTSYDQTVYHLILPEGSRAELETGLLVMADFARGALLLEEEIDRERGVIFAEKRTRDSAAYRTHLASSAFAFRGTRLPEREIIGVEETLAAMDRERLKAFYDAWYRPELLTLVVVGDMDPGLTEELIRAGFSGLRGEGAQPACPDFGELAHSGIETFYHHEPELGKTQVAIETLWDKTPENDSLELQIGEVKRMLATMIMNYRLKQLEEEGGKPFSGASYYYGSLVNRLGVGSVSARTDGEGWRESLAALDQTLRQAIEFGFSEAEVERAKREIQADLEKRAATADSENSGRIARRIIHHLNSDRVYQSAEQELQLYGPLVANITPAEVNQAMAEIWHRPSRLISVTGDSDLGPEAEALVAEAYQQAQAVAVAALPANQISDFPYLTPSPGSKSCRRSASIFQPLAWNG
jgi:zinc protease